LWQVNGKNRLTFTEMIALDLKYVDTMSLPVDAGIVLNTIPAIFGQLNDARRKQKERANENTQPEPAAQEFAQAAVTSLGEAP
jgi:lipopolysaccharide/colanic/teichoic acid biosynthesis glycosyltransferase